MILFQSFSVVMTEGFGIFAMACFATSEDKYSAEAFQK
jgi:hypothetical protein